MKIFRNNDHKRKKWKNGAGDTIEIAIFPENADLNDFVWRVSMAAVVESGPFSSFPGYDRILCVLEGNGIELHIGDNAPVTLTEESAPFAFPADQPTQSILPDGEIRDLNIMFRRGLLQAKVDKQHIDSQLDFGVPAQTFLICWKGHVSINNARLEPYDAAYFDTFEPVLLTGKGDFFVITAEAVK